MTTGIFAIYKPTGMTSHDVVNRVRRATGVKRVGHGGTLDPLASGILIIAVGRENTKQIEKFVKGEKEYIAEIKLGEVSATDDAEGPIEKFQPKQIIPNQPPPSENDIERVIQKFIGIFPQTPPIGLSTEEMFLHEKNVILREVAEHNGNHKALTYDMVNETLLAEKNPYSKNALGTEDSVGGITSSDIREILTERVVTQNSIVSILSSGDGGEAESLAHYVEKKMNAFLRVGKKSLIPLSSYSELKPVSFEKVIHLKTPINNKLITIFNAWTLDIEGFSQDQTAFYFLTSHLRNIFFSTTRNRGLGYSADLFSQHLLPNKMLLMAYLVVPSQEEKTSIQALADVIAEVIKVVKTEKKELGEILEIEKDRQLASPISQRAILENCLSTLADFDLLSSTEVAREQYAAITVTELEKMLEYIESIRPATLVIGDLV